MAKAVVDHVPRLAGEQAAFAGFIAARLTLHDRYICEHGEDMPEIRNWTWQVD